MSVEQARKHGSFDSRYPAIRHKPAAVSLWRIGDERMKWEGFRARFFPGCRRHDFDALAAYESYRNDVEGRGGGDASTSGAAETARWEGEGGAARNGLMVNGGIAPAQLNAFPDHRRDAA